MPTNNRQRIATGRCPRCGEETMREPRATNALSRYDNKTYVCSPCGTDEAVCDFAGVPVWPGFPRPIGA